MDGRQRHFLDMLNLLFERCRETGGGYWGFRVLSHPKHLPPDFSDQKIEDSKYARCAIVAHQQGKLNRPYMFRIRASA